MKIKSLPWFRMYVEILEDPKIQTLSGDTFKLWINCLCFARKNNGLIPTCEEMAWTLRQDSSVVCELFRNLVEKRLLDRNDDGTYTPHNWSGRQYESDGTSTERSQKSRAKATLLKQCNGDATLHDVASSVAATKIGRSPSVSVSVSASKSVSKTVDDRMFHDWFAMFKGRKAKMDMAARMWISVITPDNVNACFAATVRYNDSREVAEGKCMEACNWLQEQAPNAFSGQWPAAKTQSPSGTKYKEWDPAKEFGPKGNDDE